MRFLIPLCALVLAVWSPGLGAWPQNNIRVIVHVPPGGSTDNMTRLVTRYMNKILKVNFIVENYKGAGGQVGYSTLAMAQPDGYTMGTLTTMSIITHELTRSKVAYSFEKSFIPVAQIASDPSGLFVRTDSPFKSLEEMLEHARANPEMVNCGGTSLWGTQHVHCKLLGQVCKAQLTYIPFDGASEARSNLQGGHIHAATGGCGSYVSLVEAGKLRCLAVAGEERMSALPDVPTYREAGYDIVIQSRRGFMVPAGTPRTVVDRLAQSVKQVVKDPEFLNQAEKIKLRPILRYRGPADFKSELSALQMRMQAMIGAEKGGSR